MKATLKKIKECRVKLLIEVNADQVENRFQDVFRDFQKAATLPGFRTGKAPLELIEKKFSKEAHEEVLKSLVPEAYHQSVISQKVSPVSLPSISDIQMERGKKLTFSAEFDRFPEFSLKNYKGIKIVKPSMEVSDEDTEKGMASLMDSRAELTELISLRAVAKGDYVIADVEIWKDGSFIPGQKGILLFVEAHESDDFYDKIVGAQVGEAREISVDLDEEEKKRGLIGRKPAYKIWVRGIKEKKLPVLDEDFAKSFGKASVDELKEAVRKDIASYKKSEAFEKMKHELFERLLAMADFVVPEALVEKQKEKLMEQAKLQYERRGMVNGQLADQLKKTESEAVSKAAEQVKLYFILQKVAELEQIEPDEIELERRLQVLADESKRPLDEARQVFGEDLRESMRERQTIDFLLANANLKEEELKATA